MDVRLGGVKFVYTDINRTFVCGNNRPTNTCRTNKLIKAMRITLVRRWQGEHYALIRIEQLVEQMKVETKAQSVSKMREVLPFYASG